MQPANPPQRSRAPFPASTPEDASRERAARSANVAAHLEACREGARTHVQRLEELRRAGRLYDESHPIFRGTTRR